MWILLFQLYLLCFNSFFSYFEKFVLKSINWNNCIYLWCLELIQKVINSKTTEQNIWSNFLCSWYDTIIFPSFSLWICIEGYNKIFFFYNLSPTGCEVVKEAGCWTKGPGFESRARHGCWTVHPWLHQWLHSKTGWRELPG